ncbi:hypothetical protein [Agromyces allii]|uniref:WxL domain-containing protein n=1 Tax=Agromyces allii TaxID=393607 RepID=A0ABP5CCU2_9MICO|nr:hypothetical protein [Agromyces allii]
MISKGAAARCAAGIVGGLMLASVGSLAFAADPGDSSGVDVKVDIAAVENGALSLTVEDTETTLTEGGSTAAYRQFTGTLPTVTVTDTRDDVPAGVFWYVTGQAGDFVGTAGQPNIPATQLGWSPADVLDGNGEVAAGSEVVPASDTPTQPGNNTGLASGEDFLYLALDSADAKAAQGSWSTTADLKLKTAANVAPGSYSSLLTLSLFEDTY